MENASKRIADTHGQLERVKNGMVLESIQSLQFSTERCQNDILRMTGALAEIHVDLQGQSQKCHELEEMYQTLLQRTAMLRSPTSCLVELLGKSS